MGLGLLGLVLILSSSGFTDPRFIEVTLVNQSTCTYEVKVNHVPIQLCQVNRAGPLITLKPDTAITVVLSSKIDGVKHHVPAFGISKLSDSKQPVIIGHSCSPFPKTICEYFSCSPCVEYKGDALAPMLLIQ